jgi:hypothetical protein
MQSNPNQLPNLSSNSKKEEQGARSPKKEQFDIFMKYSELSDMQLEEDPKDDHHSSSPDKEEGREIADVIVPLEGRSLINPGTGLLTGSNGLDSSSSATAEQRSQMPNISFNFMTYNAGG